MSNYLSSFYTKLNNLMEIFADLVTTVNLIVTGDATLYNATIQNLHIIDTINLPLSFIWINLIQQPLTLLGINQLNQTNFNGNITQSSGSCQFNDANMNNITQSGVIVQTSDDWNLLKKTQVSELEILESLTLPSNIQIPGSTHQNGDMILINSTIQQSLTTTPNTFMDTDIYGNLRISGNLEQIGGANTYANLKNLTVTGPSNLDIINSITIDEINDELALKANTSYVNSQLAIKSNIDSPTFTGTVTIPNVNTTGNNVVTGSIFIKQSSSALNFNGSSITQILSRIALSASNSMFWDNVISTNIQFRFGASNITRHQFFSNGDLSITGAILNCPTITNINTSITNINTSIANIQNVNTTQSTNINTNTANINTNTANISNLQNEILLIKDIDTSQNMDITLLQEEMIINNNLDISQNEDISLNKFNINSLQNQVNDILNDPSIHSITIGTVTKLDPDQLPTIINVGTAKDQILNFAIPQGYRGDVGPRGDSGSDGSDGKDGSDGSNGSDGAPGDATAATIAAGVASGAAIASASAAGASAASAGASAASAAASAASAALANVKYQELQIQVDTLGEGMTQLDNDVIQLKTKTQYITTGAGITSINSSLNTNDINANSLYVSDSITVIDEVKASKFSGGLLSTQIAGTNINIGTNESLVNTINIGSASSIVTINGFVNYTNPFNGFFQDW